jgi:predicted ribosome quality control (RQC) complex YloA/Tae2 family protein
MIKNYFVLNRLIIELNGILKGFRVLSAWSQEKDKLILECRKKDEELFLEISVNPLLPYITLRNRFAKAKKNTMNFYQEYLPAEILEISISEFDRIVKVSFSASALYFYIRGNKTNIIAAANESFDSFKKLNDTEAGKLIKEFSAGTFVTSFTEFSPETDVNLTGKEIHKKYPFLGKDILSEAELRNPDEPLSAVSSVIRDIELNPPVLFSKETDVKLAFDGFHLFKNWDSISFKDLYEAVNNYVIKVSSGDYFYKRKSSLISSVEKELERVAYRINNLKARIDAGSKEEDYNRLANLLLINIGKLEKGRDKVLIADIYGSNELIEIKIDPALPPRKNIDRYFEKSRSEKINYVKSKELYEASVKRYGELKEKQNKLTAIKTADELKSMDKEKEKSFQQDKDDLKSKFRQYRIDGKYMLYIGRDSEKMIFLQ